MELIKDNARVPHWFRCRAAAGSVRVTSAFAPEFAILSSISI